MNSHKEMGSGTHAKQFDPSVTEEVGHKDLISEGRKRKKPVEKSSSAMIVIDGKYKYSFQRISKRTTLQKWGCSNRACSSRLLVDWEGNIVDCTDDHNHSPHRIIEPNRPNQMLIFKNLKENKENSSTDGKINKNREVGRVKPGFSLEGADFRVGRLLALKASCPQYFSDSDEIISEKLGKFGIDWELQDHRDAEDSGVEKMPKKKRAKKSKLSGKGTVKQTEDFPNSFSPAVSSVFSFSEGISSGSGPCQDVFVGNLQQSACSKPNAVSKRDQWNEETCIMRKILSRSLRRMIELESLSNEPSNDQLSEMDEFGLKTVPVESTTDVENVDGADADNSLDYIWE